MIGASLVLAALAVIPSPFAPIIVVLVAAEMVGPEGAASPVAKVFDGRRSRGRGGGDPAADARVPVNGENPGMVNPPRGIGACAHDAGCKATGCGNYICAAKPVFENCLDALGIAPVGAACGCVDGQCAWWRARGYHGPGSAGHACESGSRCLPGLICRNVTVPGGGPSGAWKPLCVAR